MPSTGLSSNASDALDSQPPGASSDSLIAGLLPLEDTIGVILLGTFIGLV